MADGQGGAAQVDREAKAKQTNLLFRGNQTVIPISRTDQSTELCLKWICSLEAQLCQVALCNPYPWEALGGQKPHAPH